MLGAQSREGLFSRKHVSIPKEGRPHFWYLKGAMPSDDDGKFRTVYRSLRGIMGFENIYLVNKDRKQTIVLEYEEALKTPCMKDAMQAELQNFEDMKVFDEVDIDSLPSNVNANTTRWVLSIKTNLDGSKKYKARLVARGFEALEKENITRDSPTTPNATQRYFLQVLAQKQCIPHTRDFISAFLQGMLLDRLVVLAPPVDFDIPPGNVWVIKSLSMD